MKKIQLLAMCGLIVALAGIARAESDNIKPASITVVGVQGEARYSTDGRAWHPLVVGKILHSGAIVETAANSSADLVLSGTPVPVPQDTAAPQSMAMFSLAPDPNVRGYTAYKPMAEQNVIRLSGQTMLAVDKLTVINTGADTVSDTELDLRAGKIFTNVKKMSASSQFIIKLPNGVAGIRGSSGSIGADGSAQWLTGTLIVSFIGSNGQPHVIVVHGGYQYDPQTGEISSVPLGILTELSQFKNFAQTVYQQFISVPPNPNLIYISPQNGIHATVD